MAKSHKIVSKDYPYLQITVRFGKHSSESSAIIDTGFTGHVAIPMSMSNGDLGLPTYKEIWKLADGSTTSAPVYRGFVEIVSFISIPALIVVMGDDYMLGRGVVDHLKVTFDRGKKVVVEL